MHNLVLFSEFNGYVRCTTTFMLDRHMGRLGALGISLCCGGRGRGCWCQLGIQTVQWVACTIHYIVPRARLARVRSAHALALELESNWSRKRAPTGRSISLGKKFSDSHLDVNLLKLWCWPWQRLYGRWQVRCHCIEGRLVTHAQVRVCGCRFACITFAEHSFSKKTMK